MAKQDYKSLPILRDQEGKLAIWQKPNLPLSLWLGSKITSFIITNDQLKNFLDNLSMAFLFTWAYLELTQGINYFRKALGLLVMVGCIVKFFQIVK